jgi:hypothetical protein
MRTMGLLLLTFYTSYAIIPLVRVIDLRQDVILVNKRAALVTLILLIVAAVAAAVRYGYPHLRDLVLQYNCQGGYIANCAAVQQADPANYVIAVIGTAFALAVVILALVCGYRAVTSNSRDTYPY